MVDPPEMQLSPESVSPLLCTIQYDYENAFVQLDALNIMIVGNIRIHSKNQDFRDTVELSIVCTSNGMLVVWLAIMVSS